MPCLLRRRISCSQLAEQLRQRHPAVLVHLLDRLLLTLGVRQESLSPALSNGGGPGGGPDGDSGGAAAPLPAGRSGAGDLVAAAGARSSIGRRPSFRNTAVARLLRLREELALAAAAAAQQQALAQRQSRASVATTANASKLGSWFARSLPRPSLELSRVTVESDAGTAGTAGKLGAAGAAAGETGEPPDVWHVDSTR